MSHRQSIDAIQISLIVVDSSKVSLLFWNENDSKKLSNIRMSLASEITQTKKIFTVHRIISFSLL